ncbi:serine/threonine-protein kinase pakG-like [Panonychus citri]|uniref:serine/threonine-protein kinase pakG-like n=1 Tax=Panonychus citri TaxID=50023 RepID=UPI00230746D1|nr:serine/threonine-protein kinase pakG-like [Panonychus citri]
MKWFVWLSFIILLTLVDNLTLNVNCKGISSLDNDELSVNHNGLDKSAPTIKESLASSSQLMPFFYVGDIDKSSTSKPLITKIVPKSDKNEIKTKKNDKDSSSRRSSSSSSSSQSTTPRPQLIKRIKSTKIPILIPLSSPLSANRRVFNDNELLSNLNDDEDDDEDKALPPSYKLLWYIPPRSSSSPSPSPSPMSRSSFSPEFTPLFKYNSMVANPPTGYLKPNYYHSEYHLPFNSHYPIYQPSSLNFPIYPDFPSPTSDSIDENMNIHDEDLDENNQHYQLYGKSFYPPPPPPPVPLPPSRSFTSTLYSPHHHPPPPMFPSREQPKHFTMSKWIESGLSDGPSVHRRYQRPKPSGFRSKDILQDPDIEKILSTFDLEKSFGTKKDKTYRPRKSYDDNLTMNGKYSENDNLHYQANSRGWGGFMNNGISGRSNIGHYGGRTDFKPYYDYYKNLRVSPYTVKQSAKSIQTR